MNLNEAILLLLFSLSDVGINTSFNFDEEDNEGSCADYEGRYAGL